MASISKNQGQEKWESVWKMQLSCDCFALAPLLMFKSLRQNISLTTIPGTSAFLRRPHPSSLFLWHAFYHICAEKLVSPVFCREQKLFYMLSIIANVYLVLWPQTCPKFNPKWWFSVLLTALNWLIYEEASANPGVFQQARVKRSTTVVISVFMSRQLAKFSYVEVTC